MDTTKKARAEQAGLFIVAIAGCGRRFFAHNGRVSRFEVDARGRVWFIDAYRERPIYTHYEGRWRDFSDGGTLRSLVISLRDFIRTGEQKNIQLGPWPEWICRGDPWGYGEAMAQVRAAAVTHGLMPSNAELPGAAASG